MRCPFFIFGFLDYSRLKVLYESQSSTTHLYSIHIFRFDTELCNNKDYKYILSSEATSDDVYGVPIIQIYPILQNKAQYLFGSSNMIFHSLVSGKMCSTEVVSVPTRR